MERHTGLLNRLFEIFRRFFFMPHLREYSISVINKVELYYGIYAYFYYLETCVFFILYFLGFTGKVCEDIVNTRQCSTFLDMLKGFFIFPFLSMTISTRPSAFVLRSSLSIHISLIQLPKSVSNLERLNFHFYISKWIAVCIAIQLPCMLYILSSLTTSYSTLLLLWIEWTFSHGNRNEWISVHMRIRFRKSSIKGSSISIKQIDSQKL